MTLGRTFLGAAQAPLGRSSERFSRNLIGDGVRALSAENLLAAVDAGTRALASDVATRGVTFFAIDSEIDATVERDRAAHRRRAARRVSAHRKRRR